MNSKNRLNTTPDECLKSMHVSLDEGIERFDFFNEFVRDAAENAVKYRVESQLIPKSITWRRKVEESYVNEKHEVCSTTQTVDENQLLLVWDCEETVKHVSDNTLNTTVGNIKSLLPDKELTLVMYQMESYFQYTKNMKNRAAQEEILGEEGRKKTKAKNDKRFANLPRISRKKFEECLVKIQLMHGVHSRVIELKAEMVLLIHQYTKSLASLPAKAERKQEESKVDWFANCDNRDTVQVNKDGNGLKRLWQQQLCQFNLMSLEAAEAILSEYKSPLHLMEVSGIMAILGTMQSLFNSVNIIEFFPGLCKSESS